MAEPTITSLSNINVGDFIKFVDRDKSGKFNHIGEVISITKETDNVAGWFEMLTFEGVMGFKFPRTKGDVVSYDKIDVELQHELYAVKTKPAGWAKFKKDPSVKKDPPPKVAKVIKTAKQQVFDLVAANNRKKESALLKLAKKEIGGSDSKLLTYIRLALTKR